MQLGSNALHCQQNRIVDYISVSFFIFSLLHCFNFAFYPTLISFSSYKLSFNLCFFSLLKFCFIFPTTNLLTSFHRFLHLLSTCRFFSSKLFLRKREWRMFSQSQKWVIHLLFLKTCLYLLVIYIYYISFCFTRTVYVVGESEKY